MLHLRYALNEVHRLEFWKVRATLHAWAQAERSQRWGSLKMTLALPSDLEVLAEAEPELRRMRSSALHYLERT